MDNKKIQEIQNELLKEIDQETKVENEIKNSSEEIAGHLLIGGKCQAEVNNTVYLLAYRTLEGKNGKVIFITAANPTLYKIAGTKYKPYTITAELDERYSLKDNLKTVIEAFIRHITGHVKADVLDNEESYEVGKKEK